MTEYAGVTFKEPKHIFGDRTTAIRAGTNGAGVVTIEKGDDPRPGLRIIKLEGGVIHEKWISFEDVSSLDFAPRKIETPALVKAK